MPRGVLRPTEAWELEVYAHTCMLPDLVMNYGTCTICNCVHHQKPYNVVGSPKHRLPRIQRACIILTISAAMWEDCDLGDGKTGWLFSCSLPEHDNGENSWRFLLCQPSFSPKPRPLQHFGGPGVRLVPAAPSPLSAQSPKLPLPQHTSSPIILFPIIRLPLCISCKLRD